MFSVPSAADQSCKNQTSEVRDTETHKEHRDWMAGSCSSNTTSDLELHLSIF